MDSDNKVFQGENNAVGREDDINLTQKDPTLKQAIVALGWDVKTFEGEPIDMDASCFLLDKGGMTRVDEDFVFYNNLKGTGGVVRHTGDNRTGAGDGDDETIYVDMNGLPFEVMKVVFVVSIYEGDDNPNDHNFSMVKNAYIRIVNQDTGDEIIRYKLDRELDNNPHGTAMIVGALSREGPKWHFQADGEFLDGGLAAAARRYGIIVQER